MINIPFSFPVDPNAEDLLALISQLVEETNSLRKSMMELPIDELRKKQEIYSTAIGNAGIEVRKLNQNKEEERVLMLEMKNILELYIDKMEVAIKTQELFRAEGEKAQQSISKISKENVKAAKTIEDLSNKISEYNKKVQEGEKLTSAQEAQLAKWKTRMDDCAKTINDNVQVLTIYNSRTKESYQEMEVAIGFIEELKLQIKDLTAARNALSKEELESGKLGKEYTKTISELSAKLAMYEKQISGTLEFEHALNKVRQNNINLENKAIATLEADIDVMAQARIANDNLKNAIEDRISVLTTGMTKQEIAFDKAFEDGKKWQLEQEQIFDKAWRAGEDWQISQSESFQKAWRDGEEWQKKQEQIFNKAWEDGQEFLNKERQLALKKEAADQAQFRAGMARAEEMNKMYYSDADSINKLEVELQSLTEHWNRLGQTARDGQFGEYIKKTIKEIEAEIKKAKTELKSFGKEIAESGSSNQLREYLNDLIQKWNKMGEASRKSNISIRDEIVKTRNKLQELDNELKEVNVDSADAFSSNSLKDYLAQLVSIYAVIEGVRKAFDVALKFDAITKSLGAISRNDNELNFNLDYLKKTSEQLGLDFEVLAGSYKQFSAALMDTNLEGQRTRDIFSAVSKAATVMKLPMESVEGVFLALEQIVSKGQVSMEELRKQLGNRLPGAFNLFAEGLGLTTKELNKFMKEGRITKDSLVFFADILEKKFGGKVKDVTDSLPASLGRLNNAAKSLFQKESVINFFKDFVKAGTLFVDFASRIFSDKSTNMIRDMTKFNESFSDNSDLVSKLVIRYDQLKSKTSLTKEENYELQTVLNGISAILPGLVTGFDEYGNALDINKNKVEEFMKTQNRFSEAMKKRTLEQLSEEIKIQSGIQKSKSFLLESYQKASVENPDRLNPAFNKGGAFTDYGESLYKELKTAEDEILQKTIKILELGGKLDGAQLKILNKLNTGEDQSLRLTEEKAIRVMAINKFIARQTQERINLIGKDKEAQRAMLKESNKALELERQEILHPGTTKREAVNPFQDPEYKGGKGAKGPNLFIKEMRIAKEKYETELKQTKEEYDKRNPDNTYDDDIILQKKNIKLAEDHYKEKLRIIAKYSETVHLHELDEISQKEDAENKRVGIENTANEAVNKIQETRRKKYEDAMHELDLYMQKMREADLQLQKLMGQFEEEKEKAKLDAEDAGHVDFIASAIGVEDEAFMFNQRQKRYDASIKKGEDYTNQLKKERLELANLYSEKEKEVLTLGESIQGDTEEEKIKNDKKGTYKLRVEEGRALSLKLEKNELDLSDNEIKIFKTKEEKKLEFITRRAQMEKDINEKSFEMSKDLINKGFEFRKDRIQNAMEISQRNADWEMTIAGNNEYGKLRIAKRAHKEMMDLKKKEAENDKAQAIFTATISAFEAGAASLKKYPLPLGAPFLAMNVAAGLAQVAAIASKKPPAYFKGKRKGEGKDEMARINERGFELVERDGNFMVFAGGSETLAPIRKEDKIHTHSETLKIIEKDKELKNLMLVSKIASDSKDRLENKIVINETRISAKDIENGMIKAMKSAPPIVIHQTPASVNERRIRQDLRNGLF